MELMYKFGLWRGEPPATVIQAFWHAGFGGERNPFTCCYYPHFARCDDKEEACRYLQQFGKTREEQARNFYCWAQTIPWPVCETLKHLPLNTFAKYVANAVPPLAVANLLTATDGLDVLFKAKTLVDCCAGMGGWLLAICFYRRCSVKRVYAIDIDPDVLSVYRRIGRLIGVEVVPIIRDVRQMERFPEADAIVGSPPCQQFSVARQSAPRKLSIGFSVVEAFLRLARKAGVPAVMEEVYYKGMQTIASAHGFKSAVVSLRDYGAIQVKRDRFFAWRIP